MNPFNLCTYISLSVHFHQPNQIQIQTQTLESHKVDIILYSSITYKMVAICHTMNGQVTRLLSRNRPGLHGVAWWSTLSSYR
jgi:hypothetical protein